MKQSIEYYYNLSLENIELHKDYAFFLYNNNKFYYVFLHRDEKELEDIIECSKQMKMKGINCHDIIYNKFNKIISLFGEDKYVMLKINQQENFELDIFDIINYSKQLSLNSSKYNQYQNEWGALWAVKIDYFENQVRQLGKNKNGIINSFSYYIGLAENALIYYNTTKKQETFNPVVDKITLSHRRVFFPNIWLNFGNPLTFIFDIEVRDVAEYLKSMFFKVGLEETLDETKSYLKIRKLSKYSYQMFYARLLFPTYYFDVYEKVINEELQEDALIEIVDKVGDYEIFLKNIYLEILKYSNIEKINWLNK